MVYAIKQATLILDRNQAQTQLEMLGYKPGHNVYMRFFVPDGDPRKGTPAEARKADKLNWKEVERYQRDGYGVYFVVNGGGHADKDVQEGRALFCEWDDRPIEDQMFAWQSLNLPEPTMQIGTRKSVHNYWRADLTKDQWIELQQDLLAYTQSDQQLKNPSRVLRLAGCWHIKPGCEPVRCDIIHQVERAYTYEELRAAIPSRQQPEQPIINYQPSISDDVPLYQFLTKDDRTLIDQGAGQGSRNDSGAKLARNLIGTAHRLNHLCIRFADDPRHLFHDYCYRCTPSLSTREAETIWKSALKDNPTASLTDEALENCAKAWLRNQEKASGRSFGGGIGSGGGNRRGNGGAGGSGGGDGGDGEGGDRNDKVVKFPGSSSSPLEYVKQVLRETKTKVERDSAFISSPYNPRDLQAIARELEKSEDTNEEQQEAKEALPRLLQKLSLNPHDYLWGDGGQLAQAIVDTATAMPTSPSFLITTLLPVAATLIGTSSRVVVKPSAKYKQSCVMQTGVVGRSGKIKTPSQQVIVHPLERLEVGAANRYEQELEAYKIAYTKWKRDKGDPEDEPKAPIRKRYLTKDATIESLERIHGQNPRGILVYRDELVGDFKAENSHRGGKGADKEAKLDQFNGGAIIVDRAEREIILERSAISRTGSIQWEVLQNLMGDHDDSAGVFARWIFDCAESAPRYIQFDDAPDTGIDHLLTNLYKRLELMPHADYLLSFEAKGVFQEWQHYLVNRELRESGGLQLVFPKIEAYTARFALWLHVVNAALAGETPAPTIDGHTMSRAVDMARYYLSQYELIIATNSPQTGLTGVLLKIFNHLKGKPDGTTIGKLKAGIRSLRGVDKTEIESHCQWLADNGYVTLDGKKIQIVDTVDKKLTPVSTAERYIKQWFPGKVDKVDKLTALDLKNNPPQVELSGTKAPIEGVNFVKLSTDSPQPTVKQEVDVVDRKVDNEDVAVNSVNFSDPPVVIDDAVGVTKETEEAIALRVKSEAQIATIPVEQKAPTSADEVDEAIAPSSAPAAPEPVALTKSEAVDEASATPCPVKNAPEVVETVADDHAASEAEYKELIAKSDVELKRLNWDKQQGREYLLKVYGVSSRLFLNNEQLRDFLHYLESQQ